MISRGRAPRSSTSGLTRSRVAGDPVRLAPKALTHRHGPRRRAPTPGQPGTAKPPGHRITHSHADFDESLTLAEKLAWISDPVAGSRHDSHCLNESAVLLTLNPADWIGDKGYVGNGMITPIKKPECRDLLDWEKEFNKQVNKIRAMIERVIANFKTWRIMHTDYRRPIDTFATTISAVIGLHFWRGA